MCLALPARLVELLADNQAVVELGGIRKQISIALLADARIGDYVIVHVGHAIGVIDPEEAERTLALFAEMAQLAPQEEASAWEASA
jgi:hydrogenase expression/formation protein HypC